MQISLLSANQYRGALAWLLVFISQSLYAQSIEGAIRADGMAVPFVNIGLPHQGVGTVGDEQGHYRLPVGLTHEADTVRISSVGYQPVLLTCSQLRKQPNVILLSEQVSLGEVSVVATNNYRRTHELGFTKQRTKVAFNMMGNELGTELGTIIHLDRSPALLQSLHLSVLRNEAGPLLLRLNVYRLSDKGQPTQEKLLHRDIILTAPDQPGLLTVDIAADHLVMRADFLLAIEWIKGPATAAPDISKRLFFSGGLEQGQVTQLYARNTSQGPWAPFSCLPDGSCPKFALFATVRD